MCERYGIVNCRSLDDLVETALAFDGGRLPKGPRIGFVTTSGGTVDLLYDYAEAEGAAMPDFTDATKAALLPLMQDGIAPKNPLDVGIPSTPEIAAKRLPDRRQRSQHRHGGLGFDLPRKADAWGDMAPFRQLLGADRQADRGLRPHDPAAGRRQHVAAQQAAGFPFLQGIEPTLRALNGLWFHAARRGPRARAAPPPAPPSDLSPATLDATLARYGIALPKSKAVASAAEAAAAAEAIGFPVALKLRSPDILHKTEAGGVALGLASRDGRAELPPTRWRRRRAPRSRACASTASWCRRWWRASRRSWARAAIRSTARCCSSAPAACWSSSPRMRRCGSFRSPPAT